MKLGPRPVPDPDSYQDERPAHVVDLPRYFIARFPVTVAQWRAYYDAVDAPTRASLDPRSLMDIANHPVTYVSWFDAVGYCRWLTNQLRDRRMPVSGPIATLLRDVDGNGSGPWIVTLPCEPEWEKAARGVDGRRYPWGDARDERRANVWKTGIEAVSPVGAFPSGASASGVESKVGMSGSGRARHLIPIRISLAQSASI